MTLYLTDRTLPDEISAAKASGIVFAAKLYPAGATTNSDAGVTDLTALRPTLQRMADVGLPLCIHGEATDPATDVFEREPAFIERTLQSLVESFPALRIVMEHITTKEAAAFVIAAGPNVAATITPQHLLLNRNALFEGGLRPHRYCLPVLKHESDRQALLAAIASGNPRFFLGTDSAPHGRAAKECGCGAAGVYSAHAAIELYAAAFESVGALDKLPAFACEHGANFYRLPRTDPELCGTVELRREPWTVPTSYAFGTGELVPFMAGETMQWRAVVYRAGAASATRDCLSA